MKIIKIDNQEYLIKKSTRKNKKYDVFDSSQGKKYLFSFGDNRYQHYFDKIGDYSHLNHLDEKRRKAYYMRHPKTYNTLSADNFSKKLLW